MLDFFANLFNSSDFMPHGHCYFWQPEILWTIVIGDALTVLSYYLIPFSLLYFSIKKKNPVFDRILLLFGSFILLCGTTHLIAIYTIWIPSYRLEGILKLLTGIVSMVTAGYLFVLIPRALRIPSPAQLKQANMEMATFSYSVAHDLRSPIRHIQGFASLIERDTQHPLSPQQLEFMNNITAIATDAGTRIDELLKYTRSEKQELSIQQVEVQQIVEHLVKQFKINTSDRTINWTIENLPACHADPDMIETVFLNLIDNAVKYTSTRPEASIKIWGERLKEKTRYMIRDNGIGFDMKYKHKLFLPFERLHADPAFEGYGIGLAHISRIVNRHEGEIRAHSTPGEGALFIFELPHKKD